MFESSSSNDVGQYVVQNLCLIDSGHFLSKIIKKEMQLVINDIEFLSVEQCLNYVRGLLKRHTVLNIETDFNDFIFLKSLYERNPSFKSNNISHFHIQPSTAKGKKAMQVTTHYTTGWQWTYSWRDAIVKVNKCKLTQAMRFAIESEIKQFKSDNHSQTLCAHCGKATRFFQVDHAVTEFKTLKSNFLNSTTRPVPTKFFYHDIGEGRKRITFYPVDGGFENEWKLYHKQNCSLQLVCVTCNVKTLKRLRN